MAENIEEANAQRWEQETDVSSVTPSRVPPHLRGQPSPAYSTPTPTSSQRTTSGPRPGPLIRPGIIRPNQPNFRGDHSRSQRTSGSTYPTDQGPPLTRELQNRRGGDRRDTSNRGGRGRGHSQGNIRGNHTARRDGSSGNFQGRENQTPRRDVSSGSFQENVQRPRPGIGFSPRETWGERLALVTTQRQRELEAKELELKMRNVYLGPLEEGADPFGTGYILWGRKEGTPMDLLGTELKDLDQIRTAYKVWIEWDPQFRSLKISSRSEMNHEQRVIKAIQAIRETIAHSKAKAIYSSNIFMVAVPTAGGIRSIVLPTLVEPGLVTGLILGGEHLSRDELNEWKEGRPNLVRANKEKFEDNLKKGLLALAPYKGKMRMRVHFGHVEFSMVHNDLKKGKYSFQQFANMLTKPRTQGHLERMLENATIADNLKKRILAWPQRFCARDPVIESIEDVKFDDVEVLFLTVGAGPRGTQLRIEADIDKIHTETGDEYQIGRRDLFEADATSRKLEINVLDLEKRVDWKIEVTSDNPREDWHTQLIDMIKGSVTTRTKIRKDSLGLSYPGVVPMAPFGVYIKQVCVRSNIQYKLGDSGYIVEISIYRTWEGDKTIGEPRMASSVSLFHPYWEDQMESLESKATETRDWDKNLDNFFVHGYDSDGLPALRDEINTIQDLLSAAQLAVREKASD